jgi:hypothetical protein
MTPLTNADYYQPEPPSIRTETPEPLSFEDLRALGRTIDRGYRRFCRARGINPRAFLFGRKTKQTT